MSDTVPDRLASPEPAKKNAINAPVVSVAVSSSLLSRSRTPLAEHLRLHGLRATTARICVAESLFIGQHRHVTATIIAAELKQKGSRLSSASIYNVLNDFARVGLLRTINTERSVRWFDTNLSRHHHAIDEHSQGDQGVWDITNDINDGPPDLPPGYTIIDYQITYRIKRTQPE